MPSVGGYDFAIDPKKSGNEAAVVWTAATDPTMVLLAPTRVANTGGSTPEPAAEFIADAPEGRYVRYRAVVGYLNALHVLGDGTCGIISAVMPLDRHLLDRADASIRFWRFLQSGQRPRDPRLTPLRRRNLGQMLRAVDGRLAGATYQAIATTLFGLPELRAIEWKSHPMRDTVMRRVREGFRLVNGGYRSLLLHHRT